jgi:nucleoside-diphosphate-sugar epimerase
MRIFIAGATGVLGKKVVTRLIENGHRVSGLSRSKQNETWLREHKAEPCAGNLFDPNQVIELTTGFEAILHLATAIPTKSRTTLKDWAENDRIRREGSRNLISAALRNHAALYLQQSIVRLYGDQQGKWVEESDPIMEHPRGMLESAADMERMAAEAAVKDNLPAATLRFGAFYSADSVQTRTMLRLLQRGFFPVIGDGKAFWNNIHVDDAAEAVVHAVEYLENPTGEVFNVVDDTPVTYRTLMDFLAERLEAPKPKNMPEFLARIMLGSQLVSTLLDSAKVRNLEAKASLKWQPKYPSYAEGYEQVIESWRNNGSVID